MPWFFQEGLIISYSHYYQFINSVRLSMCEFAYVWKNSGVASVEVNNLSRTDNSNEHNRQQGPPQASS